MKPEEIFSIVMKDPDLREKLELQGGFRTLPIELSQEQEDLQDKLNELRYSLRKKSRDDLKACIIQLGYFSETPLRPQRGMLDYPAHYATDLRMKVLSHKQDQQRDREALERFKHKHSPSGRPPRPKHRLSPKGRWQKAITGTIEKEKGKKRVRSFEEAKARQELEETLGNLRIDIANIDKIPPKYGGWRPEGPSRTAKQERIPKYTAKI